MTDYFQRPELNISRLLKIEKSAMHYKWSLEHDDADTDALRLGRLLHLAILEPDTYAETVVPCELDRRTKAYKEFAEANAGKTIIKMDEHRMAMKLAANLLSHPVTSRYMQTIKTEVDCFWTHHSGRACKSRFDGIDVGNRFLIDLKSTTDCTRDKFTRAIKDYRYHARAAFYMDAFEATHGTAPEFLLFAMEKSPPFAVAPYTLAPEWIESGRAKYERLLSLLERCEKADSWPGPNDDALTELEMPPWASDEFLTITAGGKAAAL